PLLHDRHLLERQFDAEVATGDHDSVEGVDDLIELVDGLRLLELGDDRSGDSDFVHDCTDIVHVLRAADEGQGDPVEAELQTPFEVVDVLLRQRGDGDRDPGEVDALVVGDGAADLDLGDHVGIGHLGGAQAQAPVVDEQRIADGDVFCQGRQGRGYELCGAGDVTAGDGERGAFDELFLAVCEGAYADLRTLEVEQDGDGASGVEGGLADPGELLLVL